MIEFLQNIDAQMLMAVNAMHSPFFDRFMMAFTGRWVWVPFYCVLAWYMVRRMGWRNGIGIVLAIGLAVPIGDQTCAWLIRPMAERLRPANLDNPLSAMVHIVDNYRGGSYGFPSCHAANTFALAGFMCLLCRRSRLSLMLVLWALATCYTRMYLGVHYPGDLLVGALVGTAASMLCYYLAQHLLRFKRITDNDDTWPVLTVLLAIVVGILIYAFMTQ